jgi:hypothetical protein
MLSILPAGVATEYVHLAQDSVAAMPYAGPGVVTSRGNFQIGNRMSIVGSDIVIDIGKVGEMF